MKPTQEIQTSPTYRVRRVSQAEFPSHFGVFTIHGFEHVETGEPFVVLSCGDVAAKRERRRCCGSTPSA